MTTQTRPTPSEPVFPGGMHAVAAPALNFHDWCDAVDNLVAQRGPRGIRIARRDPDTLRAFHCGYTPAQLLDYCEWT